MPKTTVTTMRTFPGGLPRDAVYIGRAGHGHNGYFGNPFEIGPDGDRDQVIAKFKRYFWNRVNDDPAYRESVKHLKGKRLVCFCAPLACHGDVIVAWLDAGCPLRKDQVEIGEGE